MKKILTFFVALCAIFATTFVNAQIMTQDSARGGQMKYYTWGTVIVPKDSAVSVRNIWGFNSTFSPFSIGVSVQTFTNTKSVPDTIRLFDSVAIAIPGIYLTRWEYKTSHDTAWRVTASMPVTVKPTIIKPKSKLNTVSGTTNGAIITFDYHAGFDSAKAQLIISLGDTSFNNPVLQNPTMNLVDSGTGTWTITGYPAGYIASFKLLVKNSVGADTTVKGWFKVLPSNSLWIGQVDSFGATASAITARVQVISNSTETLRAHIAYHNQSELTHIDQTVTGNGTAMAKYVTFPGLTASTEYDVWFSYVGTSTIGLKRMISTFAIVYTFKVTTDSVRTVSGDKVRVYGTVTVPSGQTAQVGAMQAAGIDVDFTNVSDASALTTLTQGLHQYTYDFENVPSGVPFRYKVYGFSSGGSYYDGNALIHTLIVVGDTVKPVVHSVDTLIVNATSADILFDGSDGVEVTRYIITQNGTVIANNAMPIGLTTVHGSYSVKNLQPNTLVTIGVQLQDNAGNYSDLRTIQFMTDANASNPTQASIFLIPSVCFDPNGGWVALTVKGTNFQPGAKFSADYHDGDANDVGTIAYISATECQVRIWNAYHYSQVDFTITNPGAGASNTLATSIIDCVSTGVEETSRIEGSLLNAFPNPFIDVVTIEVGKTTEYTLTALTGDKIASGVLTKGKNQLRLQLLPAGIYLLNTSTGLNQKIVKQ